jgi:ribosomal protein L12E/L44/L45/RPP1/RPP2
MKENLILEKNLYEAAEMLRSNKRMIKLTYAERVYLQQWIYEKTGNRISSQKCDLEEALYLFYEAKKPKEVVVDEQIIDEIIENSEVTEKQTTAKKPTAKKPTAKKTTTTKTKKVEDNETKESEEADDKL